MVRRGVFGFGFGRRSLVFASLRGRAVLAVLVLTLGITFPWADQYQEAARAATTVTTVEDTVRGTGNNQFEYTGTWVRCAGCSPATANSSFYYNYTAGQKATLRFTGTQVKIYGVKETHGGISSFSVDGGSPTAVDTYAASSSAALVYTSPVLPLGSHTLVMTNTSQRNPAADSNTLSIDKAEVIAETGPAATLYGRAGTFGNLGTTLPSGQSLQTAAVSGWGFNAGQSEFFSTLAANGEVVLGTNSQTDNQAYPTADHMSIGVFNPSARTFRNIVVPTSTGATSATNPFYPIGGASVETLLPVTVGGQPRVAFISLVAYHGWNITEKGEYPSLGYLDAVSGSLQYNAGLSRTAGQIHAAGGLGAAACPRRANLFGQQVADCRGLSEMGVLPLSQKFIVTQYFPDTANGEHSGRLVVLGTDGTVAASYTYPNIPDGNGGYIQVSPREVVVDPTSSGSLEYFTVVFDTSTGGAQSSFPLQEFAYNRSTNQIIPVSRPVLSGQTNASGQPYRFETATYDAQGNLWATQAVTNSLAGGPIVVYVKNAGSRKLQNTCAAGANWNGAGWGTTCAPDRTAADTSNYGQTRSFTQDPVSRTMFAATLSGYLLRVKQTGSGSGLTLTTLPTVNLGLDQLIDRNTYPIGIRKGVVDAQNRALYVPVVQVQNPASCPTWPGSTPCAPQPLDQWLYRFDLSALSS
ncbi:hypothetical protein I6A84_13150 [Frankia sp. CNm7]|uniref:Uncharacterized protein n=1 Tax=Frankia nepalensis TaxID=1836974 RepID=A0A937RGS4_9ACTN|nr:hypothetical protein [Frankia nepalensis]MBL7497927.1 hypothetical protein [Frankia nepalensis]MBL7512704.1 hypothetical protein [Frankia nepalensis]MBL7519025.1 hypothetical protein [Frankia nepalensis]MBL7629917.1 hypothetical protein [Frankia nepalensis]